MLMFQACPTAECRWLDWEHNSI